MSSSRPSHSQAVALWVVFCACCSCAGWILSAVHQLNAVSYAVFFSLICACVALRGLLFMPAWPNWRKLLRRFRRGYARAFLILASLAVLGGVLYPPTNYDALAYRTPRVLHWLAHGHWHWIDTDFARLNTRAPGFEWVSAPLIVFTSTDRLLFLINVISFMLLPGLVFSLFTRLGVYRRVAWHWMWIVPTGYCFLLQAGSIGNDLFGAVFGLAAVDFALRARESQRISDVWLSLLAAALLTGSKASSLPLMLPWLIAIWPCLKWLWRPFRLSTLGISLAATLASALPPLAMNVKYCGDWSGMAAENPGAPSAGQPILRLANNTVLLALQNLNPPLFPFANRWNQAMERHVPASWQSRLESAFEHGAAHWTVGELEIEEQAGLGFGVTALLLASVVGSILYSSRRGRNANYMDRQGAWTQGPGPLLILAAAVVALLALMAKSSLTSFARVITPYYALLIPALLRIGAQEQVTRAIWWRRLSLLVFALAGELVILSPARPLWPASTILARMGGDTHPLLARARAVYAVYRERADAFAPIRKLLPPDLKVLGLVSADDPEAALWRPFGHLRIEHVTHADSAADLRTMGLEYILVKELTFKQYFQEPFDQWLAEMNGVAENKLVLHLRVSRDASTNWYVVRLRRQAPAGNATATGPTQTSLPSARRRGATVRPGMGGRPAS